jgi:class 3 adenylate cyclase
MERGPGFAAFYNEMSDLVDILYGAGGTVLERHGDGLLAVFGSPEMGRRGAQAAVACARQLQRAMATYNAVRPEALADPVRLAIGVATGKVFVGSLGSVRRKEYTALGEPVLRARRLREEAKELPDPVLIDLPTREASTSKPRSIQPVESGRNHPLGGGERGRRGILIPTQRGRGTRGCGAQGSPESPPRWI